MATLRGQEMTKLNAGTTPDPASVDATVRCFTEIVTLASQTTSDTIEVARLPKGAKFLYGVLTASATLGASATIAIGVTGSTAKYRAAATFTTADTPTFFGKAAATGVALTAEETVFITIAVANLPSSGTLVVQMFYTFD